MPSYISHNEISSDLFSVKEITSGTYQRLHAIYKKGLEEEFIKKLKEYNIETLVLDEAHHLRTEWYYTLNKLIESIKTENFTIVSLTATPPYDVDEHEWNNYYDLCGPIDAEISVPELVKNKDLCPHQDLIYFSNLDKDEQKEVKKFTARRDNFFRYIKHNSDFLYAIETSSFIAGFEEHSDLIYQDVDFTVALLSYLFSIDDMHIKGKLLLNFLDLKQENVPKFDYDIAETLFNGILGKFKKHFKNTLQIKSKLKECQLLKNASKTDFKGDTSFKKLYAKSSGKLNGLIEITKIEKNNLRDNLREVILLDYIGLESENYGLNALTSFKRLRENILDLKVGILTGSIVLLPKSAKELLYQITQNQGFKKENILTSDYGEEYMRIETYGDTDIVAVVTELFEQGGVNVLIGTHALLGEGWDSPCINTLVLASTVSSFMLSNQMRGRALRVDGKHPDKTGNIWHLIAIESLTEQGYDYKTLSRRFDTFDGISYDTNSIESGIDRLGIDFFKSQEELNEMMLLRAIERKGLATKWDKVLTQGKIDNYKDRQNKMVKAIVIDANEYSDIVVIMNKIVKITNKKKLTQLKAFSKFWSTCWFQLLLLPLIFTFNQLEIILVGSVIILSSFSWRYTNDGPIINNENAIKAGIFTTLITYEYAIVAYPCSSIEFMSQFWIILVCTGLIYTIALTLSIIIKELSLINPLYTNIIVPVQSKLKSIRNFLSVQKIPILFADTLLKTLSKFKSIKTNYSELEITLYNRIDRTIILSNNANKAEENIFVQSYNALFKSDENTKYVVKLKNFCDKNIFLPPVFNNKPEAQEYFRSELSKVFGEVEIVNINTISGKRELLKAKYDKFLKGKIREKRKWN